MKSDGFIDFTAMLQPAVYALLYKGVVFYIGKTKSPALRISQHKYNKKMMPTAFKSVLGKGFPIDEVWLRPCSATELDVIEVEMIKKYRPKYNIKHNEDELIDPERLLEFMATLKPKTAPIVRRL
jgi:excinuclease UvrABC nuclease subunit